MLRQAQHERKIFNEIRTRPVRPELAEGLLRNKMLRPLPPLDSSLRWNDNNDTPVIPGKAAGRDPDSRSIQFLPPRLALRPMGDSA